MGWVLAHSRVAGLLVGLGLVLGSGLAGHLCCGELVLPAHFRPVLHVGPLHSVRGTGGTAVLIRLAVQCWLVDAW